MQISVRKVKKKLLILRIEQTHKINISCDRMWKSLTLMQVVSCNGLEWFDVNKDEHKKSGNFKD